MFYNKKGGDCTALTSQSSCDAIDACSWCKSAAVKSSCHTIDDAKALPPSIFACDKITESEDEDQKPLLFPKFGKYGHEGRERHHKRRHCCPVKVVLIITLMAYFYFLKKHQHAMEDYINAGGKLQCKWWKKCHDKKEKKEQKKRIEPTKSQSAVLEYSIVDHDKEFPEVVAPQPQVQTYRIEKPTQQMV